MKQGESIYDKSLFSFSQVKKTLIKFLKIAGYEIITDEIIGFVKPDIYARKQKYEIVISIKEKVEDALDACRDLAAMKCFLGGKKDYVLALPPVSEAMVLQFLIEKDEWYYPLAEQAMTIWLANPDRMEVHPIMGWPYDESLVNYLTNPEAATMISQYVSQKMSQKMLDEEDLY